MVWGTAKDPRMRDPRETYAWDMSGRRVDAFEIPDRLTCPRVEFFGEEAASSIEIEDTSEAPRMIRERLDVKDVDCRVGTKGGK